MAAAGLKECEIHMDPIALTVEQNKRCFNMVTPFHSIEKLIYY